MLCALKAYLDAMTLEQLTAFTVTNDHARQEQVWEGLARGYNKEPYYIRCLLTEDPSRRATSGPCSSVQTLTKRPAA